MTVDQNNPKYQEAQKHVRAERGFYINLVTFLIINAFLIIFNYITSPGNWWFYWVTLGWGIGLAFQAWGVFGKSQMFGSDWEEKKIQKYMDKNNKS